MKRSILLLIIVFAAVTMASCNMIGLMLEDDRDKFVGTWEDEWGDTLYTFEENGNCEISESPISLNWSCDSNDNELKIWSIFWVFNFKADYYFEDSDTIRLRITDLSILAREYFDVGDTFYLYD